MLQDRPIQNVERDLPRRWMRDDYFDLIVWYQPAGDIEGFQLCYESKGGERALTWRVKSGFRLQGVDSGGLHVSANDTPLLRAEVAFGKEPLLEEFTARSPALRPEIRELVLVKLHEFLALKSAAASGSQAP